MLYHPAALHCVTLRYKPLMNLMEPTKPSEAPQPSLNNIPLYHSSRIFFWLPLYYYFNYGDSTRSVLHFTFIRTILARCNWLKLQLISISSNELGCTDGNHFDCVWLWLFRVAKLVLITEQLRCLNRYWISSTSKTGLFYSWRCYFSNDLW